MLFLLFCDFFMTFLSVKNDVNVPSKSNKETNRKKKKIWHPEGH
jgi:hypothetical protein